MIRSMLLRAAPWVASAALAGSVVLYVQHLHSERDVLEQRMAQEAEAAQRWREQYEAERARGDRLVGALEKRGQALDDIARATRQSRRTLAELEKRDAELRAWMDRRLPDAAADWLRNIRNPAAGARALPGTAGAADPAATGTGPAD